MVCVICERCRISSVEACNLSKNRKNSKIFGKNEGLPGKLLFLPLSAMFLVSDRFCRQVETEKALCLK